MGGVHSSEVISLEEGYVCLLPEAPVSWYHHWIGGLVGQLVNPKIIVCRA